MRFWPQHHVASGKELQPVPMFAWTDHVAVEIISSVAVFSRNARKCVYVYMYVCRADRIYTDHITPRISIKL